MRKVFCVAALVLTLSCPALAGIIHNPAPQTEPTTTREASADGEIPNPPLTATDFMLSLLSGVLPLF